MRHRKHINKLLAVGKLLPTLVVLMVCVFQFAVMPIAHAAVTEEDIKSFVTGTPNYKPGSGDCTQPAPATNTTSGLGSGSNVYILGDSITARSASTYKTVLGDKGITPSISAMVGRSWNSAGQGDPANTGSQGSGKEAVDADADTIKNTNGIVVALGTNGYQQGNPINDIITRLRGLNATAPIWWVNIANSSPTGGGVPSFNDDLAKAAAADKFTVINWSKAVDPTGNGTQNAAGLLDSSGYHPTIPAGVNQLVALVAGALTTGTGVSNSTTSGSCQCSSSGPGNVPAVGSNQDKVFQYFTSLGYTKEQTSGVMGNIQVESGFEPQIEQGKTAQTSRDITTFLASGESRRTDRGAPGYGLVQWTGYGQLDKMADWAKSNGKDPGTLDGQLSYIGYELGSSLKSVADALKATKTVADAAAVWNVQFEHSADSQYPDSPGWKLRIQYAETIMSQYANFTGTSTNGTGGCGASGGVVAGDIVKTALGLAWHTKLSQGKINKEDATAAYQDAMPKYNGSTGNDPFSDCGVFVATVMIASGADTDYPKRGSQAQLDYVQSSRKYTVLKNITSTDLLQPGDILLTASHTMIFVGAQPEGFNAVDASLHDRVPGAENFFTDSSDPSWYVARLKK